MPPPGTNAAATAAIRLQVSLPSFAVGLPAYYVIAVSEASSNLSRYDGVRYGQRAEADGEAGRGSVTHARARHVHSSGNPVLSATTRLLHPFPIPLAELRSMYGKTRHEGLGSEVARRILMGTYALSAGYYDAYYKRAQQVCRLGCTGPVSILSPCAAEEPGATTDFGERRG